jgi:hypothetical protein
MQGHLGRWFSAALQGLSRRGLVTEGTIESDGLPHRIERDPRYSDRQQVLVDDVRCPVTAEEVPAAVARSSFKLRHIWFDYHKKCKHKIENIRELLGFVFPAGRVKDEDYFVIEKGKIRHAQQQIIRTNCIDCLDRTNVVQTFISRVVLRKQLLDMGVVLGDATSDALTLEHEVRWLQRRQCI